MSDLPSKKKLESTGETHGFRVNARQLVGGLIAIVLLIFILSNRDPITVDFLFVEWNTSQWVVLSVTALLGAAVGAAEQVRLEGRALGVIEGVDGIRAGKVVQIGVHAGTPIVSRRRIRPSRIRVFAVPSGRSSRVATSVCV